MPDTLRQRTARVLLLVCLLGFTAPLPAPAQPSDEERLLALFEARRQQIADTMEAATVFVLAFDKDGDPASMGSGFIVGEGLVMTNAHVVEDGAAFKVMNHKLKATRATLVRKQGGNGEPGEADFALLRFSSDVKLPTLAFNTQAKRMDRVSAWGFPYMITQFDQALEDALKGDLRKVPPVVYTEGTVNALVRKGSASSIFHSASIASGNSGGPLINSKGEVVGINTWLYAEGDNTGTAFAALPAEHVVQFLQQSGVTPQMAKRTTLGVASAPTPSAQPPATASAPPASATASAKEAAQGTTPGAARPAIPGVSPALLQPPQPAGTPTPPATVQTPQQPKDIATLTREAEAGSAEAQYQLGYNYFYGEGVAENEQEAATWLGKAVAQGQNDARAQLGILHLFSASQRDIRKGLALLQQAADADAEYAPLLALLLYEGEGYGVPRDTKKSFAYATRGAKANLPDAQALLGMLYLYGETGEQDFAKALELAQQAVKGESMLGQSLMAWLYFMGKGVKEDSRKAFTLAQDAAEAEESSAMGLLALLYYTGDGVDEDDDKAREWAQRASDAGNEFGHLVLGCLYAQEALEAQKNASGGKRSQGGSGKASASKAKKALPTAWAYLTLAADKGVDNAEEQLKTIEPHMSKALKAEGKRQRDAWRTERGLAP